MLTQNSFNSVVVTAKNADDNSAPVQGWVASTFGRCFSGIEVEAGELPDVCPICQEREGGRIAKRRLNAAYADDDQNWLISCLSCFEERQYQLREMWEDYYSAVR